MTITSTDISTGTENTADTIQDDCETGADIAAALCETGSALNSEEDTAAGVNALVSAHTDAAGALLLADPSEFVSEAVRDMGLDSLSEGLNDMKQATVSILTYVQDTTFTDFTIEQRLTTYIDSQPVQEVVSTVTGVISMTTETVEENTISLGTAMVGAAKAVDAFAIYETLKSTVTAAYNVTTGEEADTFAPVHNYLVASSGIVAGAYADTTFGGGTTGAVAATLAAAAGSWSTASLLDNLPQLIHDAKVDGLTLSQTLDAVRSAINSQISADWSRTGEDANDYLQGASDNYQGICEAAGDLWTPESRSIGPHVAKVESLFQQAANAVPIGGQGEDPLVLDLNGNGVELTSRSDSHVYFDYTGTNKAVLTGWATGGDGMLVVDSNNNGTIDSTDEIIGGNGPSGFAALADYDTNSDGAITSADTNFGELRVWVDSNSDGHTDSGELHTLSSLSITGISLAADTVAYQIAGNNVTAESTFTMGGDTYNMADVWYAFDTVDTQYSGDYTLDPRVLFLPEQRGYGDLPNLSIAMSLDSDLLDMVSALAAKSQADLLDSGYDLKGALQDIVYKWAGVDGVTPTDYGNGFDAQKLAFVEAVTGQDYNGYTLGYEYLEQAWEVQFGAFAANILAQSGLSEALGFPVYDPATDTLSGGLADGGAIVRFAETSTLVDSGFKDIYILYPDSLTSPVSITEHAGQDGNIVFLAGVDPGDVKMFIDSGYHTLTITSGGDYNIIINAPLDGSNQSLVGEYMKEVVFGDGTTWDLTGGLNLENPDGGTLGGTAYGDTLTASVSGSTLYGYGGNDTLVSNASAVQIVGGTGDDTYVVTAGHGLQTIYENPGEGNDTLILHGVDPAAAKMWFDGTYINLDVQYSSSTEDVLHIFASVNGNGEAVVGSLIESVVFDDSTVWDLTGGLTLENPDGGTLGGTAYGDTLTASVSGSTLFGYGGNDTLVANADYVAMTGGTGNDLYIVNYAGDTVYENASEGTDTVQSSVTYTLSSNVENLTLTGSSNIDATGNSLNNTLTGNSGDNTLDGGTGADSMAGGTGNDTYVVDNSSDTVTENSGEGTDTVLSSISYTLGSNVENLTLTGSSNINGTGNSLDNIIIGNSGNNTLSGGDGNDTISGGAGNDSLAGGSGTDTLSYANAASGVTVDLSAGTATGEGTDTLSGFENVIGSAYADTITGSAVANFIDAGAGNDTVYGGDGHDTIYGGSGDDYLDGNASNDDIFGGSGNDTLNGESSNDTADYGLDPSGVTVNLSTGTATDGWGGTDTIQNIESVTGSAYADTITGSSGGNVITAGDGNDTVYAGGGNDIIDGGNGNDVLYGEANNDTITGGAGNDTLDGGTGADTLAGGTGDDVYVVDNVSDVVTENSGEGTDTVQSSITYTLGSNVENLTLTGSSNIDGTGNTLDNLITGNSGNNTLSGGSGNDTLSGGDGLDTLTGGNGADTFVFLGASAYNNIDVISDFSTAQNDKIDIADVLSAYDPLHDTLSNFVQLSQSGSNTIISVDKDGTGSTYSMTQIATISGVTGLDLNDMVTAGQLIVHHG